MKYRIFTCTGSGYPLAKKLFDEGADVIVGLVDDNTHVSTKQEKHTKESDEEKRLRKLVYKHIVPRMSADRLVQKLLSVTNPQDYFLFFDSNDLFYYADQLRGKGFHGNFPTEENRLFEISRSMAKEFVKKYYPHIKIPEKKEFQTIADAQVFLNNTTTVWVLKSQVDSVPTFVPATNEYSIARKQVIETLHFYQSQYESAGFILEKKLIDIVELTPEKLYYNGHPVSLAMELENKFIGAGNISFQVGCAGDIVFPIDFASKIHDIAFPPIVDELAKKHEGLFIWDASLLIERATGDIYFGEFCPNRPGYNTIFSYFEQLPSTAHFFESIVKKKNPFTLGHFGISVTCFNLIRDLETGNILANAVIDMTKETEKHAWIYDMYKKISTDSYRSVGYDQVLGPVTATGKTITEAVNKLYQYVEGLNLSGVYYRPKFDFLSREYETSILSRLDYAIKQGLFVLPFKET